MSPTLRPPGEVRLKRTAMSARELRRAERLVDAAKMLEVSYRPASRLWQRYRKEGAKGLQHRSAARISNRAKPEKFRREMLQLIGEKYSGTEQERFGPTLAAEHLADEDGLEVGEETLRRWMLAEGLWSRMRRRPFIAKPPLPPATKTSPPSKKSSTSFGPPRSKTSDPHVGAARHILAGLQCFIS
jgi:transposase